MDQQTALRPQRRSESATHDSLSMASPPSSTASVTTARWERVKTSSAAISMTCSAAALTGFGSGRTGERSAPTPRLRSEEHTSELQSQSNLVCRLLLEKKKQNMSLTFLR